MVTSSRGDYLGCAWRSMSGCGHSREFAISPICQLFGPISCRPIRLAKVETGTLQAPRIFTYCVQVHHGHLSRAGQSMSDGSAPRRLQLRPARRAPDQLYRRHLPHPLDRGDPRDLQRSAQRRKCGTQPANQSLITDIFRSRPHPCTIYRPDPQPTWLQERDRLRAQRLTRDIRVRWRL